MMFSSEIPSIFTTGGKKNRISTEKKILHYLAERSEKEGGSIEWRPAVVFKLMEDFSTEESCNGLNGEPMRSGKCKGSLSWIFWGQTQNICKYLHPWHGGAAIGNSSSGPLEEFQYKFMPLFILNLYIHFLGIPLGLVLVCRVHEHHNVSSVSNILFHPHVKIFTHHTGVARLTLGYSYQKMQLSLSWRLLVISMG